MEHDRETVVESTFEVGDYAIYLEIEWSQDYVRDMVVSLYGEFAVSFTEIETSDGKFTIISSNCDIGVGWIIACASKLH